MNQIDNLLRMASAGLASEASVTPEKIRDLIAQLRRTDMFGQVSDEDAEKAARNLESRMNITIGIGAAVVGTEHRPWVSRARGSIEWFYWGRYREMLQNAGWPSEVVAAMDRDTDRVLDGLANPREEGTWDRRGMVIGNVQSGKTANYIGLLAKAADAGYRVIIVIAGIHEVLRSQTQGRIDEGFLGWDTGRGLRNPGQAVIGVGRLQAGRRPGSWTSTVDDFGIGVAGINMPLRNLNEPVVFVIKKNYRILQTLMDFLKSQGEISAPCLVIDDEADNASINIRYSKDEVSKINELIRTILTHHPRSAFVAYTATPFANVFIDPDSDDEMLGSDLFPKDFILTLDSPSNYFGAEDVFGDIDAEPPRFLRYIADNSRLIPLKHKKDLEITALPGSLQAAVRTFIVACAIRTWRGQGSEHMSMLVNVSVFKDVQRRMANALFNSINEIRNAVRIHSGRGAEAALQNAAVQDLWNVWRSEYERVCDWNQLFPHLSDAVMRLDIIEVNSNSSEGLSYEEYDTGRRVIAIGGYSLSRGLTLEGLTTSYFLRNSRMYDTLMQMARWFGYRPGYEDLCRVWMTEAAAGWYAHIAGSIEELRDQVRVMETRRATPMDFGLMVRAHPDALIATSRSKMGSAEERILSVHLSQEFIETPILHADRDVLESNLGAVQQLASRLQSDGRAIQDAERWPPGSDDEHRSYLVRDVNFEHVIDFLGAFKVYERAAVIGPDPIIRYIQQRVEHELRRWDILFPSVQPSEDNPKTDLIGPPIWMQSRTAVKGDGDEFRLSTKFRVASRGIERAGLDPAVARAAEEEFLAAHDKKNVPDKVYRAKRKLPLLIVHLLAVKAAPSRLGDLSDLPVAAWSISFPVTKVEGQRVEYVVNTTWLRNHFGMDEEEEFGDD
jgi:hypothetical protein